MRTLLLAFALTSACGSARAAAAPPVWVLVDQPKSLGWGYRRFVERDGSIFALPGFSVSRDGGRTWEDKSSADMFDAAFSTRLKAIAVGEHSGRVVVSTDAGSSWTRSPGQPERGLYALGLFNETDGFGLGESGTILTRDGGRTWSKLDRPGGFLTPEPRAAFVLDDKRAWAAVDDFEKVRILRTDDRGRTWEDIPLPGLNHAIALCFTDAANGWLLGEPAGPFSPPLLATRDGGKTWKDAGLDLGRAAALKCLACRDENAAWAVGPGLLVGTKDAGRVWATLDGPRTEGDDDVGLYYGRASDGEYLLLGTETLVEDAAAADGRLDPVPNGAIYRLALKP